MLLKWPAYPGLTIEVAFSEWQDIRIDVILFEPLLEFLLSFLSGVCLNPNLRLKVCCLATIFNATSSGDIHQPTF